MYFSHGRFGAAGVVQKIDDDVRAPAGQLTRDLAADPAACAGDEGDFSFQAERHG
jgi:hypothetical protein